VVRAVLEVPLQTARAVSVVTETPTTEAPIMLRADITRAELADLKVLAIKAGMTTQEFLAMLIRERIAA
jgi:hypothetical protein